MNLPFMKEAVFDNPKRIDKSVLPAWTVGQGLADTNQNVTITIPSKLVTQVPLFAIRVTPNYAHPANTYSPCSLMPCNIFTPSKQNNVTYNFVGPCNTNAYLSQCHIGCRYKTATFGFKLNGAVIEKGSFKISILPFCNPVLAKDSKWYETLPSLPFDTTGAYPLGLMEDNFMQLDASSNRYLQVKVPWMLAESYLFLHGDQYAPTSFILFYLTSDLISSLSTDTTLTFSIYNQFEDLEWYYPLPAAPFYPGVYNSDDTSVQDIFTIPGKWIPDGKNWKTGTKSITSGGDEDKKKIQK